MDSAGAPLLGRSEELNSLDRLLSGRDGPEAHFVAVSGEPGIGKTRLLAELAWRAAQGGHLVFEGRATELERAVPFAPFIDALDDYLGSLHPRRLEPLGPGHLGELARVFPALAEFESGGGALETERYRLHRATRGLLELLASRAPLVLELDDSHWADEASTELLVHLLKHRPRAPVLVTLAFRPRQAAAELAAELAIAAGEGSATLIGLSPLTEEETGELLGDDLSPEQQGEIFRESGGNPFFAQQLARSPGATGSSDVVHPTAEGIPQSVAAAIGQELGRVGERARLLLDGAAAAGDPFDIEIAACAAGIERAEGLWLVDELLRHDLVRATEIPTRLRFRHPIVHRAVYESAGHGWRLEAHRRIAEELERRVASPLVRAPHVERSAQPGDEAAIEVLREAAALAAPRAPAAAAVWLDAALRLLPEDDHSGRFQLLVAQVPSLLATARLEDVGQVVLEALDLLPEEAGRARVELIAAGAIVERLLGRMHEAEARLLAAREEFADSSSPEAIRIEIELLRGTSWGIGSEIVAERTNSLRALAGSVADPAQRTLLLAVLAMHEAFYGNSEQALADVAQATAAVEALSDEQVAGVDAIAYVGLAEYWLDDFAASALHLEQGIALARATGQSRLLIFMLAVLGHDLVLLGRTEEGLERAGEAVEAARSAGVAPLITTALVGLAVSFLDAGDLRAARTVAQEGHQLGQALPANVMWAGCTGVLAITLLEHGDPAGCLELIDDRRLDEIRMYPRARRLMEEGHLGAYLALGRLADAHALAASSPDPILDPPASCAVALRARARLLLAEGAAAEAAETALDAVHSATAGGAAIDAARARIVAGTALAEAGNAQQAKAELEAAHESLDALRAVAWRDEAARELRKLGLRVARNAPAGGGPASLSPRELEVAELVGDGRTNKEIAAALFLSEKTVEKHLSRVFEKLAVSRRGAVAARLAAERERSAR